jgi:hypothetical protein
MRGWVVFAAFLIYANLVLAYGRFPLLVATLLAFVAVASMPWSRRVRSAILGAAVVALGVVVNASPGHYLSDLFSTQQSAAATVRLASLSHGLSAFAHHPFTGVGLGQYGASTGVPSRYSVIQAGADMGILGLLGLLIVTVGLPIAAARRLWQRDRGLSTAALAGAAVYVLATAFAGGALEGLFVGLVSIYGLSLALFAGIGLTSMPASQHTPLTDALAQAAGAVRARLSERRRPTARLRWLAYSVIWTPAAAWILSQRLPGRVILASLRRIELNQELLAHRHGFGPIVRMLAPRSFTPAGLVDDPGQFLITPWVSDLLHTQRVDTIVRTVFIAAVALLVATYPNAIRRLTGSVLAALLSPVLVLLFFDFLTVDGFYWVPAVTIALCLPWLLLWARERRSPVPGLILVGALGGIASIFRSNSGLGVLIATLAVCLLAAAPRSRKAVGVALIAAAYVCISSGVIGLAYQARADRMSGYAVNTEGLGDVTNWTQSTGLPFWHVAYIGLGVVHNRYGIHWADSVAASYVHSVDPSAPYVSARYEAILRHRVLHILTTDPGLVFRAEKRKLGDILADGLGQFPALLVLAPLAIAFGAARTRKRRYSVVLIPVTLFAMAAPMFAVPLGDYELPWLGLLATIAILCSCWLLAGAATLIGRSAHDPRFAPLYAPVRDGLADLETYRLALVRRAGFVRIAIATTGDRITRTFVRLGKAVWSITAAAFAVGRSLLLARSTRTALYAAIRSPVAWVAVLVALGGFVARGYLTSWRDSQQNSAASSPTLPYGAVLPPALRRWSVRSLLTRWTKDLPGVALRSAHGSLHVKTTSDTAKYQLNSPALMLPAGHYMVAVQGNVESGGMTVGVLGVKADHWIARAWFVHLAQPNWRTMPLSFDLASGKLVRVILSNLSPAGQPSEWLLSQILITPAPGSTGLTPPAHVTPQPDPRTGQSAP